MKDLLDKINECIEELGQSVEGLHEFLLKASSPGELCVVGGALRDAVYHRDKSQYKVRDLDLIFNYEEIKFSEIIKDYNYTRNRFGGYKIFLKNNFEIDIWSYKNNWAVKNKLIEDMEILETISKGSFYNIDSLAYSFSKKEVFFKNFESIEKKKILDFVNYNAKYIESNPFREINIIRALFYSKKYNLQLSSKIIDYIGCYRKEVTDAVNKLYKAQYKHYKHEVLSKPELYLFLKKNNISYKFFSSNLIDKKNP